MHLLNVTFKKDGFLIKYLILVDPQAVLPL